MPVDMSKCLTCGRELPLVEFHDVDAPHNSPKRRSLMCVSCQMNDDDKNYPPCSPWRRAEREIEYLYGVKPEAYLASGPSPLGSLFYALVARAMVKPKRFGLTEKRRNPLHYGTGERPTIEDAMRLCAVRGYHTIQGRTYDDERFAAEATAGHASCAA